MKRLLLLFIAAFVALAGAVPAAAAEDDPSVEAKYDFLVRKGIFTGFAERSARLRDPMTREQFAAVLFRLWELLGSVTYQLSVPYVARNIRLESDRELAAGAPVRERIVDYGGVA